MALELFACKNANSLLIVHTHNVEYKSEILNRILRKYMLKNADLRLDDDYGEINSIKKLFGFYFATEL